MHKDTKHILIFGVPSKNSKYALLRKPIFASYCLIFFFALALVAEGFLTVGKGVNLKDLMAFREAMAGFGCEISAQDLAVIQRTASMHPEQVSLAIDMSVANQTLKWGDNGSLIVQDGTCG